MQRMPKLSGVDEAADDEETSRRVQFSFKSKKCDDKKEGNAQ